MSRPSGNEPAPEADEVPFLPFASRAPAGRFLGVPFVHPPLSSPALFNPWAYLFGPFYFFAVGLWRKGLVLLTAGVFVFVPTLAPTEVTPLASILHEAYAPFPELLQAIALLFVILWCRGHRWIAAITGLSLVAVFVGGAVHVPGLRFDYANAYEWLTAPILWKALMQVEIFSLLAQRPVAALVFLLLGGGFWYLGLPLHLFLYTLPSILYPVFCGMMANYDLYRHKALREVFWW